MSLDSLDSFVRSDYPQQVSVDQADHERCEIAFSNGASFTAQAVDSYSEHGRHRMNLNSTQINSNDIFSNIARHNSTRPSNLRRPIPPLIHPHRPTPPPRHPDYSDYSQRLGSYARWVARRPDSIQLTGSGFFFTNQGDLVRCYQCGIGLKDFSEEDDPLTEHVRHSGDCPFLLAYLGAEQLSAMKAKCQIEQPMPSSYTYRQQRHTESDLQCRHPVYQTVEARISSFTGWLSHMIQTPVELAEAGLFYTGVEDHVRCFTCDGGLRRWDPEDVPWTEHCRWFPACPFAREKKGDDFIALVQVSAEYNNGDDEGATDDESLHGQDLSNTMEQLTLRDPEFRAALNEHKETCAEMGFQLTEFNDAVQELRNRGNIKPTIEDLLDTLAVLKDRKQRADVLESNKNETPLEENLRLKSLIICMACGRQNVNALFLPCTHHRLCMDCAEPLTQCPVCEKHIRQKIKTYLAWIKPNRNVEFSVTHFYSLFIFQHDIAVWFDLCQVCMYQICFEKCKNVWVIKQNAENIASLFHKMKFDYTI